jgi:hypothetical protein
MTPEEMLQKAVVGIHTVKSQSTGKLLEEMGGIKLK